MHIIIDSRPMLAAPNAGISRQVVALHQACTAMAQTQVSGCTEAPLEHPSRQELLCPAWGSPLNGMQRPTLRWRFEARFLPQLLRKHEPDVYIATANMGLPIGRKGSSRWVVVVHDLFQLTEHNYHRSKLKAAAYRIIDRLSIAWSIYRADAIWCPSQFTAQQIAKLFPRAQSKVHVLPNQVTPPGSATDKPAHLPSRYWLVVGTREPRKNIHFFLQTWTKTAQQEQLPDLLLVGDSTDFPEFSSHPNIHWHSQLSETELATLYRYAECLWQPSYAEGFGLPVVEALAMGTPVAVAKGSALDEVAPPDSPRFSPTDNSELHATFLQLAQQPIVRDQQDFANCASQYSADAYKLRVAVLIQDLVDSCA